MFSLESPHRGDSNEYTPHIIFNKKKKKSALIILNLPLLDFSKGLKNEFETAVVDKPSVLEPLKFFCNSYIYQANFFLTCLTCVKGTRRPKWVSVDSMFDLYDRLKVSSNCSRQIGTWSDLDYSRLTGFDALSIDRVVYYKLIFFFDFFVPENT